MLQALVVVTGTLYQSAALALQTHFLPQVSKSCHVSYSDMKTEESGGQHIDSFGVYWSTISRTTTMQSPKIVLVGLHK